MKKRKEKVLQEKKLFSSKKLIIILFALAVIIVFGFLLSSFLLQTREVEFSLKAAIIDQLGEEVQNYDFNETGVVANILRNAGFNVSYYESKTVDVNFYKGLSRNNYGIIILRAHSATREGETIVDFFTSEEFNGDKYVSEQNNGWLTKGFYSWRAGEFYFAITPKFIKNLEGCFPKSIVIAMGCNSLNKTCTEMAEAFIKKGAKAYIGWTGLVLASHTDNETIELLRMLLRADETIEDAVNRISPDWHFYPPVSKLRYYPESAGGLKISGLIAETNSSSDHQSAVTFFKPISAVCITSFIMLKIRKKFR